MEKGLGHLFIVSSISHFFNKTNIDHYLWFSNLEFEFLPLVLRYLPIHNRYTFLHTLLCGNLLLNCFRANTQLQISKRYIVRVTAGKANITLENFSFSPKFVVLRYRYK